MGEAVGVGASIAGDGGSLGMHRQPRRGPGGSVPPGGQCGRWFPGRPPSALKRGVLG